MLYSAPKYLAEKTNAYKPIVEAIRLTKILEKTFLYFFWSFILAGQKENGQNKFYKKYFNPFSKLTFKSKWKKKSI